MPTPHDIPRATTKDWLITAGLAVVLSVPMVGAVRLLDGDSPSTLVPDATTPGATTTAGAAPTAPAGQIVTAPAADRLTRVGDRSASEAAVAKALADQGRDRIHHASSIGIGHHAALMLVAPELATHTAVQNGDWSDARTWGGEAPTAGARVVIPEGVTVTVDGVVDARLETVGVYGTLRVATDVDTHLWVDTIVSAPTALFEIGTADQPVRPDVTARITFIDDGPIDRSVDPDQLGRGAVLHGRTEIHGAAITHRTVLGAPAQAGDQTITLAGDLAGWKVGDQIIVTSTNGPTNDDVRTITAIATAGGEVTLDSPLQHDHVPPRADLTVYVGNTSRNVIIESENHQIDRRGHVMFMHTNAVDVNHVRFDHLGRTDKSRPLDDIDFGESVTEGGHKHDGRFQLGPANNIRARYSVHVHRGGVDPNTTAARIAGSVVFNDPGWGFVNHSSNVDFIDNVAYDVLGGAFFTEAGDEVGSMIGNLAIRSFNPNPEDVFGDENALDPDLRADRQDYGFQGDGYWLQGNRVMLHDNVSAGASGHGFIFWTEGLVEKKGDRAVNSMIDVSTLPDPSLVPDRDQIHVWWAPLAPVTDNVAYGGTIGFRSRYVHGATYLEDFDTPPQAYLDSLDPVVDGLTVWGNRDGVLLNYNERLSLINADIVGIGHGFQHNLGQTAAVGVGLDLQNEVTNGPGYLHNIRIEGFEMGFLAPRNGVWDVDAMHLANTNDILIHETHRDPRVMHMNNVTFGSLDGTAVADDDDRRNHVELAFDVSDQPLWFLVPDVLSLNGEGIWRPEQAAGYVPLGEQFDDEPEFDIDIDTRPYVGLTNAQLQERTGLSLGGAVLPDSAREAAWLRGGLAGPMPPVPTTYPQMVDPFVVAGDADDDLDEDDEDEFEDDEFEDDDE
ncbi:MAG: G8 domain-containing protein [Actinomycetota bacterium]